MPLMLNPYNRLACPLLGETEVFQPRTTTIDQPAGHRPDLDERFCDRNGPRDRRPSVGAPPHHSHVAERQVRPRRSELAHSERSLSVLAVCSRFSRMKRSPLVHTSSHTIPAL